MCATENTCSLTMFLQCLWFTKSGLYDEWIIVFAPPETSFHLSNSNMCQCLTAVPYSFNSVQNRQELNMVLYIKKQPSPKKWSLGDMVRYKFISLLRCKLCMGSLPFTEPQYNHFEELQQMMSNEALGNGLTHGFTVASILIKTQISMRTLLLTPLKTWHRE